MDEMEEIIKQIVDRMQPIPKPGTYEWRVQIGEHGGMWKADLVVYDVLIGQTRLVREGDPEQTLAKAMVRLDRRVELMVYASEIDALKRLGGKRRGK